MREGSTTKAISYVHALAVPQEIPAGKVNCLIRRELAWIKSVPQGEDWYSESWDWNAGTGPRCCPALFSNLSFKHPLPVFNSSQGKAHGPRLGIFSDSQSCLVSFP